jgi:chromosome segregation ATPase
MNSDLTYNEATAEAILDALQDVITDIDQFMFDWMRRFDRCAQQTAATEKPNEQLRQRIKEFQAHQRQWESQRQAEQDQLTANANQLTDAWLRLEAEQRALLQTGNLNSQSPVTTHTDRQPTERVPNDDVDQVRAECQSSVSQADYQQTTRVPNPRVAMPREVISRDAAVRQFEILKNELLSSRKQPAGRSD